MKKIIHASGQIFLLLFTLSVCLAQQPGKLQEQCATMEQDSILRRKYPELGSLNDFEQELQQKISEIKLREKSGRTKATVISIPVIVHIIHNGEPVGTGRNLSAAQVRAQLEVLNEDFRRLNPDRTRTPAQFASIAADIEIEFCPATKNQAGQTMPEPGIDRVRGNQASWTRNDIEGQLKPQTSWDPTRYYNIWVLDFASGDERLLGYAQFPTHPTLAGLPTGAGAANTDGVVVAYTSFGAARKGNFPVMTAPYNQGRTLTHETGHWLGLRHIWGDGSCADDFCDDTPPQPSESRGCSEGRLSCDNRTLAMVQNYMDYSDDACMNLFTRNQKTRMLAVMELSPRRRELISSTVCGAPITEVPRANFFADKQKVLRNTSVQFTDLSSNAPTRWFWRFKGGIPATDTTRNPVVRYDTAGRFEVTLVAFNQIGRSDSVKRTGFIEVLSAGQCSPITNFRLSTDTTKPGTPTVLRFAAPASGYVAGHNSLKHQAKSEFFLNDLQYTNLSGASLRFGSAFSRLGASTESTVTVVVWNARGFQNGPGAVLERREVPLRTILDDVARGQPTNVNFERNIPINGLPFHVGIQLKYEGDSVALVTTRDGEWTFGTAWEQDANGQWERYTIARGQNVAHAITPVVGMRSSVQITASSLFINSGESVTLNARGASLFAWQSPGNDLSAALGPQVVAQPTQTTTYTVTGSGLDLCNASARITVFVRNPTSAEKAQLEKTLSIYPNPGKGVFTMQLSNDLTGMIRVRVINPVGKEIRLSERLKEDYTWQNDLDLSELPSGLYYVELTLKEAKVVRKVVKW